MDEQTKIHYTIRAKIIKALAHPTRLFIIDKIANKEYCVCELTKMIGADISTVSKHLSVLKNAGIVKDEKRGTLVYYTLQTPCILGFFDCIEAVIEDNVHKQLGLVCSKSSDKMIIGIND